MHVVPAQLQSQAHQVRQCGLQLKYSAASSAVAAATSANERATPDAILTGSLSANGRDEWRAASHDDGVSILANLRNKASIEGVDAVFSLQSHLT